MKTVYYSDFDGTIATVDVGNVVLNEFAGPVWEPLAKAYVKGDINSQQCLSEQYSYFRATEEEFKEFILTLEIDPFFPAFHKTLKQNGHDLVVLSDGMRQYIDILFEKYSVEGVDVRSNSMKFDGNSVKISFPHLNPDCDVEMANCKCSHIINGVRKVYIGDGVSDACAARNADVVYAKVGRELKSILELEGREVRPFKTFEDVMIGENMVTK